MKKLILGLMFPIIAFGQYTPIPDSIFELRLISLGYDSIHDGQVLTSNIINVDSLNLNLSSFGSSGITDLTGIESFINLTFLSCRGFVFLSYTSDELINIDLSQNTSLQHLDLRTNQISNLDLSQNTSLQHLDLRSNQISNLDLSQNVNLTYLKCGYNQLSYLDLNQNINLTHLDCYVNQLSYLDLSQNVNLSYLDCSYNQLSHLDLSQNINLTDLECAINLITFLDLEYNTILTHLNCRSNKISYLNVNQDTALVSLNCSDNNLSSLDINQNPNLTSLNCSNNQLLNLDIRNGNNTNFTFFRCRDNDSLNCISVDDSVWANTNWNNNSNLGSGSSIIFSNNCPSVDVYTNIPDSIFEQKLIYLGHDSVHDGQVLTSNIRYLDSLDVSNAGITDLTGIEDFTHISYLNCNMNELINFDISKNAMLENLQCRCSGLNDLDLKQNPNLSILNCNNDVFSVSMPCLNSNFDNDITNLNLFNNSLLTSLDIISNNLLSLDIRQNSHLINLNCQNNKLKVLDLRNSNNINLTYLNAQGNDSLYCIASDDSVWSSVNLNNIPSHSFFSNYCPNYYTQIPDRIFEQNLIDKGYDFKINGQVLTMNIINIDSLSLNTYGIFSSIERISNLKGIQDFINLTYLNCVGNELDSLDLSYNPNLTYLDCSGVSFHNSSLSALNVSQNNALTYLNCHFNQLDTLDLSQNNALTYLNFGGNNLGSSGIVGLDLSQNTLLDTLICNRNSIETLDLSQNSNLSYLNLRRSYSLTNLDLRNGNNINFTYFDCRNNGLLQCISVDDQQWADTNWNNIDPQTMFSNDCNNLQYTLIPDSIFEQRLIDLGYDNIHDGQVFTANISSIDSLDISGIYLEEIEDLTGIEDFISLITLDCGNNNLSSLDLSQNALLTTLNVMGNNLSSLDVSQNTSLNTLNCFGNNLSSLDISQNLNLMSLNCWSNQLNTLDVSQNPNLTSLYCWNNQLNILDVSQNPNLTSLNCSGNILSSLDISQNPNLTSLNCFGNSLLNIDLSLNSNLSYVLCSNNLLANLDIRNGNNTNIGYFDSRSNDSLFCISVDDSTWSVNNWTNIDSHTNFSNDCNPSTIGIIEIEKNLSVYPNPTNENIIISINNFNGNIKTEVYDLIGNKLQTTNKTTISLNDYSEGIYILKLAYGNRVQEVKVIKE